MKWLTAFALIGVASLPLLAGGLKAPPQTGVLLQGRSSGNGVIGGTPPNLQVLPPPNLSLRGQGNAPPKRP